MICNVCYEVIGEVWRKDNTFGYRCVNPKCRAYRKLSKGEIYEVKCREYTIEELKQLHGKTEATGK